MKTLSEGNTRLNRRQVEEILTALAYFGEEVPIYYRLRPNLKDANDDMVFECAANFGAAVIVTHNVKDFTDPELKYQIAAVRPGDFIRRIRSDA